MGKVCWMWRHKKIVKYGTVAAIAYALGIASYHGWLKIYAFLWSWLC